MKKRLIAIGALIIGIAAIGAAIRLNHGQGTVITSVSGAAGASCCPIPLQTETERTAPYQCETCGKTYEKAGSCCGAPTQKLEQEL